MALDHTHREDIRNTTIETKSSSLQAWFSRIAGLPETQHIFGQTIDFANNHFHEITGNGLYGNGYRHFEMPLTLSPSVHTKFRLTLAPWEKIATAHFMYPSGVENRIPPRKVFSIYKTYLEAELGTANKTEGEDTDISEFCSLMWEAGGLQLSLKLYRDGREQMLCTGLHLSHKELTNINKENRAKFYRLNCDLYTQYPINGQAAAKRRISTNLDKVIKSVQCYMLDEGCIDDICYANIDPYWYQTLGQVTPVHGEDYQQITMGSTGGRVRIFDAKDELIVERNY